MKPPFKIIKHKEAFLTLNGDYVLEPRFKEKGTKHWYMIVFQDKRKYYK